MNTEKEEWIRLVEPKIELEDTKSVVDILTSGMLIQGKYVKAFENEMEAYLDIEHAIACSSGTSALHLAFLALDLNPNDEVILPAYSFLATANMIEVTGAKPVFVDIDRATFNIDVDKVSVHINKKTKAVLAVHLFGLCADMRPLVEICEAHKINLIEDAACAIGSRYPGKEHGQLKEHSLMLGSQSIMSCLSFHPRKLITTGEGGMVVTKDEELSTRLRQLRNHGATLIDGKMHCIEAGYNYRMTEFQAAIGISQIKKLGSFIEKRRLLASHYNKLLSHLPVSTPYVPSGFFHTYQSYIILLPESVIRDNVIVELRKHKIEASIGTYAFSLQEFYSKKYHLDSSLLPNCDFVYTHSLALPLHPRMDIADVARVVETLFVILDGLRL